MLTYSQEYVDANSSITQYQQDLLKQKKKATTGFLGIAKKQHELNSKEYWVDVALRGCRVFLEHKHNFHAFVAAYWLHWAYINGKQDAKPVFDKIVDTPEFQRFVLDNDLVASEQDVFEVPYHLDYCEIRRNGEGQSVIQEYKNEKLYNKSVFEFRKALSEYTSIKPSATAEHRLFFNTVTYMATHQIAFCEWKSWWEKVTLSDYEKWFNGNTDSRELFILGYRTAFEIDNYKAEWEQIKEQIRSSSHLPFLKEWLWEYSRIMKSVVEELEGKAND